MKPQTFRICSYNIHKGFGASNRRFLLDDMRTAIRSVDADICFLQEVVGHRLGYGKSEFEVAGAAQNHRRAARRRARQAEQPARRTLWYPP